MFQSHNGAIAACLEFGKNERMMAVSIPQWCDCCYCCYVLAMCWLCVFQSHNGAIAAVGNHSGTPMMLKFQSHNGAIAARHSFSASLMLARFQSHNGAIAAFP